jgi:hypothetical protein
MEAPSRRIDRTDGPRKSLPLDSNRARISTRERGCRSISARLAVVPRAFAFRAELVGHPGIVRTIAVAEDQTLEQLHEALRMAFGWADQHLYSFWPSGEFWDDSEEFTAPFELEERGPKARSSRVAIGELDLRKGKKLAYCSTSATSGA